MNPWWKRPSSESSSTASREADKRTRSRRSDSGDDNGQSEGSRRRRGRRGGRGRSQDSGNKSRKEGSGGNNNRRGRSRGSRRGRRGRRGRDKTAQVALLLDVEALHKSLKAADRPPEDATELLTGVGKHVARRAVASGSKRRKAQRALSDLGFNIEQVDGGAGAARLRLALDALELALANRGAHLYILADAEDQDDKSRRTSELQLLCDRLRDHGAEVTLFSVDEPLVIDNTKGKDSDQANEEADAQSEPGTSEARAGDSDSSKRRRRRRGRRGRGDEDRETAPAGQSGASEPEEEPAQPAPKSTSEPLSLLTAAIGKLVEGESQLVWATKVRQQMSSIDPLFNELDHGYDDFDALLREAERRGRITLQKDPRTSTFVIVGWRAA